MINGRKFPSAGSIVYSVMATTSLTKDSPDFDLIGKPNPFAVDLLMQEHGIKDKSKMIMVGDRPNTDITFGANAGIDTCLVFTGVVRDEEDFLKNWEVEEHPKRVPTHFMQSFGKFGADNN